MGLGREKIMKVMVKEGSWGSSVHEGERRWSGRGQETLAGAVPHSRSEVWQGPNRDVCEDRE